MILALCDTVCHQAHCHEGMFVVFMERMSAYSANPVEQK